MAAHYALKCSDSFLFFTQAKVAKYRPLYMRSKQPAYETNSKFPFNRSNNRFIEYINFRFSWHE